MKAYFVTGSSGVGKSTLVRELRTLLPYRFVVSDFDEVGVPLDADTAWRIGATNKWILIAKEQASRGLSSVIVGLTHPQEVCDAAKGSGMEIAYCMLEAAPEELKRRLFAHRFSSPERVANLKRYEGVTPEEYFRNNEQHVSQMHQEARRLGALFVDATQLSPRQTAKVVRNWVLRAQ